MKFSICYSMINNQNHRIIQKGNFTKEVGWLHLVHFAWSVLTAVQRSLRRMDIYSSFGGDDVNDGDNYFDEFLFQSIQRYNTLQMFNLENVPHHLLQLGSDSLCVASRRPNGSSELLRLKLPPKITLSSDEKGISKGNDFEVLSGIYIDNQIYQIGNLAHDTIITSEINIPGLQIYTFSDSSLDCKKTCQKLDCLQWMNPNFMVVQELSQLICSKCSLEPAIQIDALMNKKIKDIKHPFCTLKKFPKNWPKDIDPHCENNIKCTALSPHLIGVLHSNSGQVFLHDLRTEDLFTSLPQVTKPTGPELWTLSSCDMENSLDYLGILSNATSLCIYDIKKSEIVFQKKGEKPLVESHMNMKMKFSGMEKKFSVSGMNCFVEIYKIQNNVFESVFIHDGHSPKTVSSVFVTDHIWLAAGNKEYIVSICDNKTLHCWN